MENKPRHLLPGNDACFEECPHGTGDLAPDEGRKRTVEDDLQALVPQTEAHEMHRPGEENAARSLEPSERTASGSGVVASDEHECGAAVSEERRRDDIRRRAVPPLESEAGEFDREDQRHLGWMRRKVVAGSSKSHNTPSPASL